MRKAFVMHALSPLHAGTGQGSDVIDLPIARLKSSGIPFVPGSSGKGVLRAYRRDELDAMYAALPADAKNDAIDDAALDASTLEARTAYETARGRYLAAFGPEKHEDPSAHAGAFVMGDARLLVLPVRSFAGAFAMVTSPLLLTLAARDHAPWAVGHTIPVPGDKECAAGNPADHANCVKQKEAFSVMLEELSLSVHSGLSAAAAVWANSIATALTDSPDEQALLCRRFVVVSDDMMAYLWETATQIDARNSIDPKTGVVQKGQLWWEESLPPESVLIGQVAAERSRRNRVTMTASEVLDVVFPPDVDVRVQIGGKATIGRGYVRLRVLSADAAPEQGA